MYYVNRSRGFGMRPNNPEPSPYAQALFGEEGAQSARRSELRFKLIKNDMLKMGSNSTVIKDEMFGYVVRAAWDKFKVNPVTPIHLNDIFGMDLDIRKSSPGLPWQPEYATRGEVMDCPSARNRIRWFWHRIKAGEQLTPDDCKVLYRAHIQHDEPKIRAVYGYPTAITLMEACFALPLINEYKLGKTPIAYGFDMAIGGAWKLRSRINKYQHFGCVDFSSFDKTVSAQLIKIAFSILEQNIDIRRYQGRGIPDANRLYRAWDYLIKYFLETPLRLCNGERWKKKAGVPSGSYFTQLIDSVVNWILINYAYLKRYGKLADECHVFGDDSVISSHTPFKLEELSELLELTGMTVNVEKSIYTSCVDEVEFLGFKIEGGFPCRRLDRWMEALYHPEWPDQDWDMFASRALGLFYANCGVEREFAQICRNIVGMRSFTVHLPRDTERMLRHLGVQIADCSPMLPLPEVLVHRLLCM
nr:MAG: putative RNA dependent RNA polymerase [Ilomantsi partiti-like virus 2]UUV42369.1 MAG: putative RNA dependent RNA polymerase [Ilomantsi partiti-like virus 2]UUV42370.1 MAG: putative RNA dependent RNA polymerase [Ilomantsi partiti-like virus 2]